MSKLACSKNSLTVRTSLYSNPAGNVYKPIPVCDWYMVESSWLEQQRHRLPEIYEYVQGLIKACELVYSDAMTGNV